MTVERRIIEGIEACRPGSDDLLAPELDDVARQVQQDAEAGAAYRNAQAWDAAVAGAMERVPVPDGLAGRILQRLAANGSTAGLNHASGALNGAPPAVDADAAVSVTTARNRRSRRAWVGGVTAAAATVLVALGLVQFLRFADDTPVETMADDWLAQLGPTWQVVGQPPEGFAVPPVVRAEPAGWQRIGQFGKLRGVAYKLTHPNAGMARLLVVRLARNNLPGSPPSTPQSTTGGRSIGYWRNGDLLYVLVVEGNEHEQNYRHFVDSSRTPLA